MEEKILNRLLNISDKICLEIEHLANLSVLNLENDDKFKTHLLALKEYMEKESVIVNTIDYNKLKRITDLLCKRNEESMAGNRLLLVLDEKIEQLVAFQDDCEDNEDEEELDIKDSQEDIDYDLYIYEKYYEHTEYTDSYVDHILDNISITTAKKIRQRIEETITSDKKEQKFKRKLIDYLKQFKYYIFTIDTNLEKTGLKYGFNVENIPNPTYLKGDELIPIYNNECVDIICKMYSTNINDKENRKVNQIAELLYDIMCFEECMDKLNIDNINKLIALCEELNKDNKNANFGTYCYRKLLQKKN